MSRTFFARFALPILMLVFFVVPFALRGARLAFTTMKNDVKDWLPADFEETRDLEWFRQTFLGEQFILVTWPGCTAEDTRYKLLVEKLKNELQSAPVSSAPADAATNNDADSTAQAEPAAETEGASASAKVTAAPAQREQQRVREMGDRLGLSTTGNYFENWGGAGEKWLQGDKEQWYYITPQGELYRWDGGNNVLGWASRRLERLFTGTNRASGTLEAQVGPVPAMGEASEYHTDPRKMNARFFKTVTTGPEVMARLTERNGGLWPRGDYSDEEKAEIANKIALERLTGSLFGPDGKQTCMIVTLSDVARRDLKRALGRPMMGKPPGRLLQLAEEAGLTLEDLRFGGPPVDNVAIDEEGSITLVRLIGWSLLLGVGLAYFCFRSVKITIMIFFVGGVSAMISLAFVWYLGDSVDAIVMSMPSLVYVLGLTSAVHMLTYYRHHAAEHGLEGASEATILHTWKPLLLAQFTSALGLLSLLTSNLSPIRKFGYYSALGTIATLFILYLYLPSALQLWPPGYHKKRKTSGDATPDGEGRAQLTMNAFWQWWSGGIVRNHYWIAPAVAVLVICTAYGATRLKTNVHLLKMFDGDAKIIRDYEWLEQNLGKLVPMELVVRVAPQVTQPPAGAATVDDSDNGQAPSEAERRAKAQQALVQYNFLERMELASLTQAAIEEEFGPRGQNILGKGMSAATFAPPIPAPSYGLRSPRNLMNRKLETHRDEFLHSDYLRVDRDPAHESAELWRISLRLGALNDVDYGEFVNDLKSVVEPVMAAVRQRKAIVARLLQERGDQGLTGARVAVVGVARPTGNPSGETAAPALRTVSTTGAAPQAGKHGVRRNYDAFQDRWFARTLCDLLENRGFKASPGAKTQLDFLTAQSLTTSEGAPLSPAQIAERLASYDCVLLAQEFPACDWTTIQKHAPAAIDARDYRFDPFDPKTGALTAAKRGDHVQTIYTGVVPVVYKAQRTLLDSLVSSTNYAFVSIALCLMVLLRRGPWRWWNLMNCRAGLVAMFPNMFPLAMVFGTIGWLGIEVDIGSMMTASIAIGVAVDDTIHYLEWFRNGMKQGLSRREAIVNAYQHSGSAIIETMLIAGLGLSVFAFSTFTPTQRFGLMMLTMLVVGAIGELIWMPSLLAGPLGKYFEPILPTRDAAAAPADGTAEPRRHVDPPHAKPGVMRKDAAH